LRIRDIKENIFSMLSREIKTLGAPVCSHACVRIPAKVDVAVLSAHSVWKKN
jgi:hypothetical protein